MYICEVFIYGEVREYPLTLITFYSFEIDGCAVSDDFLGEWETPCDVKLSVAFDCKWANSSKLPFSLLFFCTRCLL